MNNKHSEDELDEKIVRVVIEISGLTMMYADAYKVAQQIKQTILSHKKKELMDEVEKKLSDFIDTTKRAIFSDDIKQIIERVLS